MNTIIQIIKKHRYAFFLAILIGLIYTSHHFFIPWLIDSAKDVYYPITRRVYYDEAAFYGARANAVFNGEYIAGDINTYEHRGGPVLLSLLNPLILGGISRAFGSLERGIMVSDFLFPALIFLLLYALALTLYQRKMPSLFFATLFILAPKFWIAIPPVSILHFQGIKDALFPFFNLKYPLYFSGFEEPKLTFLFYVAAFLFIFRALKTERIRDSVFAGIAVGLLFYTYFYDWMTVFIALGLYAFFLIYSRDRSGLKQVLIIGITALVISIPYWINFWLLHTLPQANELLARAGTELSHRVRLFSVWKSYLRNLALLFFVWVSWGTFNGKEYFRKGLLFFFALLLSYFVTVNIQMISGFNVQPDHWYRTQFLIIGLAWFIIFLRAYDAFSQKNQIFLKVCGMVFLVYFFSAYGLQQYLHSIVRGSDYMIPRADFQSYRWLQEHTLPQSSVGTISFVTNQDILLHTKNTVFLPNGLNTLASDEEIWQRFFYTARLFGVREKEFKTMLKEGGVAYNLFSEEYGSREFDKSFSGYERMFPDWVIAMRTSEYGAFLQTPFPSAPYRLDYLYAGPREYGIGKDPLLVFPSLKKEYDKDGIRIYSLPTILQ